MPSKITNVIGAPFQEFVTTQLATRAVKSSAPDRTLEEVSFLGNKTAWVRLQSSIKISGSISRDTQKTYYDIIKDNFGEEAFVDSWTAENLPSKWVLQGGTSYYNTTPSERRALQNATNTNAVFAPLENDFQLRSGVGNDNAYGLGGLEQGYRPMPGITDVLIETKGIKGSLRFATITFKVWNMNQLDLIDMLYFRLGFSMLLEWGHAQYFEDVETGTLKRNDSGIDNFYDRDVTKEAIQQAINKKVFESRGNYDGMLGVVTNYDYTLSNNGGWDCSIRLIGLGSIMDTQRVNSSYKMPPGTAKYYNQLAGAIFKTQIDERKKAWEKKDQEAKVSASLENDINEKRFNTANPVLKVEDLNYDRGNQSLESYLSYIFIAHPNFGKDNKIVGGYGSFDYGDQAAAITTVIDFGSKSDRDQYDYYKSFTNGSLPPRMYIPRLGEKGFTNPLANAALAPGRSRIKLNHSSANARLGLFVRTVVGYESNFFYEVDDGGNTLGLPKGKNRKLIAGKYGLGGFLAAYVAGTTVGSGGHIETKPALNFGLSELAYGNTTITKWNTFLQNEFDDFYGKWVFVQDFKTIPGGAVNDVTFKFAIAPFRFYDDQGAELPTGDDAKFVNSAQDIFAKITTAIENNPNDMCFLVDKVEKESGQPTVMFEGTQCPDFDGKEVAGVSYIEVPGPFRITDKKTTSGYYREIPSLRVKLRVKTNVVSWISDISNIGAEDRKAKITGGNADPYPGDEPTEEDKAKVEKAGGFESALEAMLTIIQFKTLVDQGKNTNAQDRSLVYATAQMLSEIKGAPLKDIFTLNAAAKSATFNNAYIEKKLDVTKTPDRTTDPTSLGIKGYNTALMSGQIDVKDLESNFDKCYPTDTGEAVSMFQALVKSYCIPVGITDSSEEGDDIASFLHRPVYIKLGYLLFLINNLCLLYDDTKGDVARPFFYIDYNPNTNFCLTMPHQISIDPFVALIPFKGTKEDYRSIFTTIDDADLDNAVPKLWNPQKQDAISDIMQDFNSADENLYQGRHMNILVNVQHLLNSLKETSRADSFNGVYLKPFLDDVLRDINKALGDVNALRVGYVDASNTIAIVDDQVVPPSPDEGNLLVYKGVADDNQKYAQRNKLMSDRGRMVFPVLNNYSLMREFKFETYVTSKMSSLLAIGASPARSGSAQAVDASNIRSMSKGLVDKIITVRSEVNQDKNTVKVNNEDDNNAKIAQKFNNLITQTYQIGKVDKDDIDAAKNYLIQGSADLKATNGATNSSPVIPLNVNFTIDGISGIMLGNGFLLSNDVLPITVRDDGAITRFGFVVIKLDHKLHDNQWTTEIEGQMVRMRDVKYPTGLSIGSGNSLGGGGSNPFDNPRSKNRAKSKTRNKKGTSVDDNQSLPPSSDPNAVGPVAIIPDTSKVRDSDLVTVTTSKNKGYFIGNIPNDPRSITRDEWLASGERIQTLVRFDSSVVSLQVAKPLYAMIQAAKNDGVYISVISGFRQAWEPISEIASDGSRVDASSQKYLYDNQGTRGISFADPPGKSKHGFGIAFDLNRNSANSAVNIWLCRHAWRFGFIKRYPGTKERHHWEYRPGENVYAYAPKGDVAWDGYDVDPTSTKAY